MPLKQAKAVFKACDTIGESEVMNDSCELLNQFHCTEWYGAMYIHIIPSVCSTFTRKSGKLNFSCVDGAKRVMTVHVNGSSTALLVFRNLFLYFFLLLFLYSELNRRKSKALSNSECRELSSPRTWLTLNVRIHWVTWLFHQNCSRISLIIVTRINPKYL